MKLFRRRRVSVNSMLGITKAKKRANKALGITAMKKPLRAKTNLQRRARRTFSLSNLFGFARRKKRR